MHLQCDAFPRAGVLPPYKGQSELSYSILIPASQLQGTAARFLKLLPHSFPATMAPVSADCESGITPPSICFCWQSVLATKRVPNTGVDSSTLGKKAVIYQAASCTPNTQRLAVRRNCPPLPSSRHLDLLCLLHIGSAVSSLGISPLSFVKFRRRTSGSHCSLCAAH